LRALLRRLEATPFATWADPALALCRCDPSVSNFVWRPHGLMSVDWENSGWGDPAFEVGDLLAHPTYVQVSAERHRWVVDSYAAMTGDTTSGERIWTYYVLMIVGWTVYFARMLHHELLPAEQQRLVARAANWREETVAKYRQYLDIAHGVLA
jgi:thiamine kinase-like enzyme